MDLDFLSLPSPSLQPPTQPRHPMLTRYQFKQNPYCITELHPHNSTNTAVFIETNIVPIPKTLKIALKSPKWKNAMLEELSAHHHNCTWVLVHSIIITQYKEDGFLDPYKANLVAKGYIKIEGLDYEDNFNLVVQQTSIWLIIYISISSYWIIKQLHVKNAFLNGLLKEKVLIEYPPGFIDEKYLDYVCLLKKSHHGLKHAPKAWLDHLSQSLISLGFKCSRADPSLFIFRNYTYIIVHLIYVDDVLLIGLNTSLPAT